MLQLIAHLAARFSGEGSQILPAAAHPDELFHRIHYARNCITMQVSAYLLALPLLQQRFQISNSCLEPISIDHHIHRNVDVRSTEPSLCSRIPQLHMAIAHQGKQKPHSRQLFLNLQAVDATCSELKVSQGIEHQPFVWKVQKHHQIDDTPARAKV